MMVTPEARQLIREQIARKIVRWGLGLGSKEWRNEQRSESVGAMSVAVRLDILSDAEVDEATLYLYPDATDGEKQWWVKEGGDGSK